MLHQPGYAKFGSPKVFDLIERGDSHFSRYSQPKRENVHTLATALERVLNDMAAHYDPEALKVDEDTCLGIGGRKQIATLTFLDGFRWVPGFEPAEV